MTDEELAAIRERVARYPDEEDIYDLLAEVERLRVDRDQMQQSKYRAYEHVERLKRENATMHELNATMHELMQVAFPPHPNGTVCEVVPIAVDCYRQIRALVAPWPTER